MKLQVLIRGIAESHFKYWGEFIFLLAMAALALSSAVLMSEVVNGRVSLDAKPQAHVVWEGHFACVPASARRDWNLTSCITTKWCCYNFKSFFLFLHAHDFLVLREAEISDRGSLFLFLYGVVCHGLVIQWSIFLPDCLILSVNCSLLFYD